MNRVAVGLFLYGTMPVQPGSAPVVAHQKSWIWKYDGSLTPAAKLRVIFSPSFPVYVYIFFSLIYIFFPMYSCYLLVLPRQVS